MGLLQGDDFDTCKQTVKDKIGGIVVTAWKFWPLVHCITYGVIPARHRILWVNSVDLIWNAILATQAQKEQPENAAEANDDAIDVQHALHAQEDSSDSLVLSKNLPTPVVSKEAPEEVAVSHIVSSVDSKLNAPSNATLELETDAKSTTTIVAETDDKVAP